MENLQIKTCEQCQCDIEPGEEYFQWGQVLCYECAIDTDPKNEDYHQD